jgi:hypothetical protein
MDSVSSIFGVNGELQTSAVNAVSPIAQLQTRTAEAQAAQTAADAQAAQEDTVHLSAQAQAQQLYERGSTENEIARTLNTTTQIVDGYLGLTFKKELARTLHPPLKA